jgi:phosphomannomutase
LTKIRFGTDGWRAAVAEDFTFSAVRRVAHGVARYIEADPQRDNRVVVGYDRRFASERFAENAADIIAQYGFEVILSDRAIPTQLSSFVANRLDCAAFVVTASHNQWQDNGIKIKDRTGAPAAEGVLRQIEENIPDEEPILALSSKSASIQDLTPPYLARLRELVDLDAIKSKPSHFVVDAIHGCGAGWLERVITAQSVKFTGIRSERDAYFGGVNPEPIPPNITALQTEVASNHTDGGIAFDGDADRVGLVTESGQFVNQLQVYGLLYQHLLEDRRLLQPAVYTVSTTDMVPRLARAHGTQAYETPVGFKYVGPKMQEVNAIIGGEESGGFGFGFHLPERDGLLSALMLLEMRAQRSTSFDELLNQLQRKYGPSEYSRIDLHYTRAGYADLVASTMSKLDQSAESAFSGETVLAKQQMTEGSGFKLRFADGSWLLFRFSGTEPVLRVYAEAPSKNRVAQLLEAGKALAS